MASWRLSQRTGPADASVGLLDLETMETIYEGVPEYQFGNADTVLLHYESPVELVNEILRKTRA